MPTSSYSTSSCWSIRGVFETAYNWIVDENNRESHPNRLDYFLLFGNHAIKTIKLSLAVAFSVPRPSTLFCPPRGFSPDCPSLHRTRPSVQLWLPCAGSEAAPCPIHRIRQRWLLVRSPVSSKDGGVWPFPCRSARSEDPTLLEDVSPWVACLSNFFELFVACAVSQFRGYTLLRSLFSTL